MILPFSPHLPTLFQGFPSYTKVQCNLPTAAAVEGARRVHRHNWTSKSSWKATELVLGALDATGKTMEYLCFFGYYLSYSKNLVMVWFFKCLALSGTGWPTHRKTYWPFELQVGSLQPDHGPHGSGYRIPRPANPAKPTSKVDNIPCMLQ